MTRAAKTVARWAIMAAFWLAFVLTWTSGRFG